MVKKDLEVKEEAKEVAPTVAVPTELDELKLIVSLCSKYGVTRINQVEARIAQLQ